ncbi:MAG TPA: transposase [Opitutus sp.]|nr:transposase [Opitutus sp.]
MARKLRVEFGGACYHVINRGNYRKDLFTGKGAAESFQQCLEEAAARFHWRVHAFVVMRNHFHLAVETPEPNLSEGMKWLQGTWIMRFNRFRGETGRPFQGRYKALHVEPGHALAQVAHYIHLNPVRAKAVTPEALLEYRWSSLPLFAKKKTRPQYLEPTTILTESGGLRDSAAGWRRYVDYLGVLAEEDAKLREERFGRLSRGWAIGSAEFKADLKLALVREGGGKEKFAVLGADRDAHRELKAELWEERVVAAAKAFGTRLDALPPKQSAPEKVRLAALMKAATSVSNGWLAERLKMGSAGNVSQYVRRFHLRGENRRHAFKAALA